MKGINIVLETLIPIAIVGLLIGCVYALMAFGLSIQFGVMNLINFAHGDFVMLSMYVTYFSFLVLNLPTLATPILTVPLFFVIGFLLYKIILRGVIKSSQVVQIAVTVGMFMAMRGIAFLFFGTTPRSVSERIIVGSINILGMSIPLSRIAFAAISILVLFGIHLFLTKTHTGLAFRAVADDKTIPHSLGINVDQINALAFGFGTALAALSGAFLMSFSYVDPMQGFRFITLAWVIVVMAGLGTIRGVVFSGCIVGIIETFTTYFWSSQAAWFFVFLLFIIILWLRPKGLWGIR